jgi:hypothetical protein
MAGNSARHRGHTGGTGDRCTFHRLNRFRPGMPIARLVDAQRGA